AWPAGPGPGPVTAVPAGYFAPLCFLQKRRRQARQGLPPALRAPPPSAMPQETDGPRPRDWGVLASGDGCLRPSSREPYSVIRAGLPPHGVCSSATRVLVVSSRPATDAPF